ncbi:permease [Levilactobacillus namurensis DSM 19117]|uniref:Permease n=1 Tax=Levilactobacillus namurensis DSM 19117 TaxID=1423773 RepID=A0A0R1JUZ1_9LACO|nr:AI-2E family transporter [Levilactobacillus namurensis]KRK74827.1 permease [Levilactobacillus namurensis DSM 19117]GEO74963.1 AI-2E family transporter [Levilactobacillus namurensis]HJE45247.1 AI-2E family transporter [Levilactobacillus namurensis]
MTLWQRFIDNVRLRRFVVLALLIFVLWLVRSEMNMILLTFIFTFMVLKIVHFVRRHVKIPAQLIVILTYVLVLGGLYWAVTTYLPQIVTSSVHGIENLYRFYQNPDNDTSQIAQWITNYISTSDLIGQVQNSAKVVLNYLSTIGSFGVTLFMSMILSFFFTIEDKQMAAFSKRFLTSTYSWFFQDIKFFADKFVNTFGVVLEAQLFIALCNTAITTVVLAIMQMPQLPTLAIMIFVLSLVPVAGVIVSIIPLAMLGYSVGGYRYIIYILVMIVVVHTLEAYVLNPKFMASRTELPIFYTFVVLLAGEQLFGVWGLIVGVPIFTFFLDILGVRPVHGLHPGVDVDKLRQYGREHIPHRNPDGSEPHGHSKDHSEK